MTHWWPRLTSGVPRVQKIEPVWIEAGQELSGESTNCSKLTFVPPGGMQTGIDRQIIQPLPPQLNFSPSSFYQFCVIVFCVGVVVHTHPASFLQKKGHFESRTGEGAELPTSFNGHRFLLNHWLLLCSTALTRLFPHKINPVFKCGQDAEKGNVGRKTIIKSNFLWGTEGFLWHSTVLMSTENWDSWGNFCTDLDPRAHPSTGETSRVKGFFKNVCPDLNLCVIKCLQTSQSDVSS